LNAVILWISQFQSVLTGDTRCMINFPRDDKIPPEIVDTLTKTEFHIHDNLFVANLEIEENIKQDLEVPTISS